MPPVPPVAASDCEYAVPTVAFGSELVAMVRVGALTGSVSALVAVVFDESLTCTVNEAELAVVGVPEIVPEAESDNPAGSDPDETVH